MEREKKMNPQKNRRNSEMGRKKRLRRKKGSKVRKEEVWKKQKEREETEL